MALTLGEVSVTLLLNMKQFVQGNKTAVTSLQSTEKVGVQANQKLGSSFMTFLKTIGLVTLGIGALKRGIIDSVKSYLAAEDVNKKLLAALDGNLKKMKELEAQADRLQATTIFDDETIKESQTYLALQDRTQEQIKKTISAAVDYASVTGKDLPTAVKELNMTYEENIGRLGRLDTRFKDLTPEQLRNGAAIDLIAEKYRGFGEVIGNTTEGKIRRFQNAMGELQEGIGQGLIESFAEQFDNLSNSILGATTNAKELGKYIGQGLAIAFKSLFGIAIPFLQGFIKFLTEARTVLRDVTGAVSNFSARLLDLPSKLPIVGDFFNKLKNKAQEYLNVLYDILDTQDAMANQKAKREDQYDPVTGEKLHLAKDPMKDPANKSTKNNTKDTDANTKALKEKKKELDQIEQLQEDITKLEAEHQAALTKYGPAINRFLQSQIDKIRELKLELKELMEVEKERARDYEKNPLAEGQLERAGQGREGGAAQSTAALKPDKDAWIKHWTEGLNFATQIMNILNRRPDTLFGTFMQILAIAQQVAMLISPGIGGLFGAITGVFGMFGSIFGLATGGSANSNQPYVVGEKGRELFVPEKSGIVIPNWITEAILKGGGNFSGRSKFMQNGGMALGSGGGAGSIYIINTGEMSEGMSTRVIRKGMAGYNIIMQKKGSH